MRQGNWKRARACDELAQKPLVAAGNANGLLPEHRRPFAGQEQGAYLP